MEDANVPRMPTASLVGLGATVLFVVRRGLRARMGSLFGVVLDPALGFHGARPVWTVAAAGLLVVVAGGLLRHLGSDPVAAAREQHEVRHLAAWLRTAPRTQRRDAARTRFLALQQQAQSRQMRRTPLTLLVVAPSFAWLAGCLARLGDPGFALPWNPHPRLLAATVFPHWVLLYLCQSIPAGSLPSRVLRVRRLRGVLA